MTISATEFLFLLHPRHSAGRELVKLCIQELVSKRFLAIRTETRLIDRRRAGTVEITIVLVTKVSDHGDTGFEQFLLDLTPPDGLSLRQYFRAIDKKLYGIEVFKHLVYKELVKKSLVRAQFHLFGFFRSEYEPTKLGKTVRDDYAKRLAIGDTSLAFPYYLVSDDEEIRLRDTDEISELIPADFKQLSNVPGADWESAANQSGLDPRGFLPI